MSDRARLLRKVQMCEFAIQEVALFLDTHPNNKKALAYYHKHREMHEQAVAAYQKSFGPLTTNGVWSDDRWTWVADPWPWETEE